MKKIYLTLILITAICAFKVSAQGVPAAYAGDYNRMMANQNMLWMHMNMTRMMNQNWYRGLNYQVNNKYEFTVVMKDSSVKVIKSKIYADTVLHKSYLIYVNKNAKKTDPDREQKIYANQTARISRVNIDDNGTQTIGGFATDSCWLFKVVSGKINAYSYLSEVGYFEETYLKAFQYGDNKVVKLDSVALDPIIKTNPKAYKAFLKGNFFKAIDKYNADSKK